MQELQLILNMLTQYSLVIKSNTRTLSGINTSKESIKKKTKNRENDTQEI